MNHTQQEKSQLFTSKSTTGDNTHAKGEERKTRSSSISAAQDAMLITKSLQRTKNMMHQELNRLQAVTETIDQDGRILNQTKDEHLSMKGGIQGAKGSLGRLKLKEREDQIIFWLSVVYFYLVVLYVLWTRIPISFLSSSW